LEYNHGLAVAEDAILDLVSVHLHYDLGHVGGRESEE
jgi:hypothetical protein